MPGFVGGFVAPPGPPPLAPGFLSRGTLGSAVPPPPPSSTTEGIDYCVVACDMWGCAYGEVAGVQVTQVGWQLDDKGSAAFTFPIQQVDTSTFGVPLAGLSNKDTLPSACIPGGREVQVWRNHELEWWGVPISATPTSTLVTIQCEGLLWWVDNVLFGPVLTESLIDGDFEVSGALGGLDTYWPASAACAATLIDANTGQPGVVTGRWAAQLQNGAAEADAYIESQYVVGAVFDGLDVSVSGWVYIDDWVGEALDGRGIFAVLYENGIPTGDTWTTQLTASMPVKTETQVTLAIGPINIVRDPHIIPAPVYTLGIRLYCPQGEVVWDDVHVTVQPPTFNGTATAIASQLLAYAQDPTQGKSTFAMPTQVVGPPPPQLLQRDYLGQSQNSSVLGAFAEFVAEGIFDYEVTWDPTGHFRTFTMYCPSKGTMQYNYPLTLDAGTVTQITGSIDGSQVGSTQRVLGQGSGGAGSEYAYRAFGGFLGTGRGTGFPGGRLPRVITDAIVATTVGVTESTLVSFSAAFDANDVGQPVTCLTPGVLPPGCYIGEVLSVYEAVIFSSDEGLVTSIGGSQLTVSIGAFTIEKSQSAQTNQPPGALAGLAQGNLLRQGAAQAMLSPRMSADGSNGSNGLLGNVFVGDVIPVETDYGWLTISGTTDGEPILQRVVALTLYPVTNEIQPTLNVINTALGGAVPVADLPGVPIPYAGVGVPLGYVLCDGAGYDPVTYPSLFSAIGYIWGGAGSVFHVPDFRGRALVGAGGGHAVGASFGAASTTLGAGQIPQLTGALAADPHDHIPLAPASQFVTTFEPTTEFSQSGALGDHSPDMNQTSQDTTAEAVVTGTVTVGTPSPAAVPTVPPSRAVQWLLRAF